MSEDKVNKILDEAVKHITKARGLLADAYKLVEKDGTRRNTKLAKATPR